MTRNHLILSAVFAVGLSSTVSAGSITTSNGASCNDSYNNSHQTDQSVTFGTSSNFDGDVSFNVQYQVQFGGTKRNYGYTKRIDCNHLLQLEEQRQQLELQRLKTQVAMLQKQLQGTTGTDTVTTGDDW